MDQIAKHKAQHREIGWVIHATKTTTRPHFHPATISHKVRHGIRPEIARITIFKIDHRHRRNRLGAQVARVPCRVGQVPPALLAQQAHQAQWANRVCRGCRVYPTHRCHHLARKVWTAQTNPIGLRPARRSTTMVHSRQAVRDATIFIEAHKISTHRIQYFWIICVRAATVTIRWALNLSNSMPKESDASNPKSSTNNNN